MSKSTFRTKEISSPSLFEVQTNYQGILLHHNPISDNPDNDNLQINNKSILIINIQPQKIDNHIYDYIIINNSYVNLNIINNTTTGKEYIIGSKVTPIQMKVLENQNRLLKLNLTTTDILYFD